MFLLLAFKGFFFLHTVLFQRFHVWGDTTTLRPLCLCRNNPVRGLAEKMAFSERELCVNGRAVPSCTQRFFGVPAWGGITTLGARFMPLKRWTPAGHGGLFAVFMPPRNLPRVG